MSDERWTSADLPDLTGKVAVVTGANSGLGYHTALELARRGARTVLACRDVLRGEEALGQLRVTLPSASLELRPMDLASLDSVRRFAADVVAAHPRVDLLVNNAGVMAVPRQDTPDGFELQFGTNHLGHFALTGLLLPSLVAAGTAHAPARVVTVSSMVHRSGRIARDDLMGERSYRPWVAYAQSKLANLLFFRELRRRLDAAGLPVASLAAHPGYAATNLAVAGPRLGGSRVRERLIRIGNAVLAQPAAAGAWPSLRAAGDPGARSGDVFGPGGFLEQRGPAVRVDCSDAAKDDDTAAWLWDRSVTLTGVGFDALTRA